MLNSINCRAILPVACAVTGFVIACCFLLYSFIKSDLVRGEIEHASGRVVNTLPITGTGHSPARELADQVSTDPRSNRAASDPGA